MLFSKSQFLEISVIHYRIMTSLRKFFNILIIFTWSPILENINQIHTLTLAESKCTFEDLNMFEWNKMTELRYLNARSTFMSDEVLHSIAVGCSNLISLNLYGCSQLFHKAYQVIYTVKFRTGNQNKIIIEDDEQAVNEWIPIYKSVNSCLCVCWLAE